MYLHKCEMFHIGPHVDVTFVARGEKMQISWHLLDLMVIQSIESNAYDLAMCHQQIKKDLGDLIHRTG